jgi:hypothetical protein
MKIALFTVTTWLFAAGIAFAQQSTGAIGGRILDPQGAAVAGAAITAKNPRTGLVRSATSDEAGNYRLAALPVGAYELSIQKEGFDGISREGVDVSVAQTHLLDINLQIAAVQQQVNVTGSAPLIDLTTSAVGQLVDPRRVQDLPINGRQFANLAATLPGVGLAFHSDPSKGIN